MDLVLDTAPTRAEILSLVSVPDVKKAKRIAHNLEDDLIADMIVDAYQHFDGRSGWLRRAILPQAWTYFRPKFSDEMEIPLSPLLTVAVMEYLAPDNNWTSVDTGAYEVINGTLFGKIVRRADQTWPTPKVGARAVAIGFTAGWAAGEVPGPIRRAIMLLAGSLYEHREADFEDNRVSFVSRKIEYGIEHLAGRYRIPNDLYDAFAD